MFAIEYIALAVVGGLILLASAVEVATTRAITGPTELDDEGTVCVRVGEDLLYADPVGLAKGAGLDRQAYALARCIYSEASGSRLVRRAVAHAVLNYARSHGRTLLKLLTDSNGAGDGYFGRQDQGRYAATSRDPDDECLEIAVLVVNGYDDDPTGGAEQWDSPNAYGTPGRAEEIEDRRLAAGNQKVLLAGVSETTIRFWRPS